MQLSLYQYRIPFKQPFVTSSGSFTQREGIYLMLNHQNIRAFGEAAPLPEFSRETLLDTIAFLAENKTNIEESIFQRIKSGKMKNRSPQLELPPALAFAVDTLIADYRSKLKGQSLRSYLFTEPSHTIKLNATLSIGNEQTFIRKAENLICEGIETLKLKVGVDFKKEFEIIKTLRQQFPGINIRIDVNQSWTETEAVDNLKTLEPHGIEYCEEPLVNPTAKKFQHIKKATAIRLALDESLHQVDDPITWIKDSGTDILIIKPMIMGSLKKIRKTCNLADSLGIKTVFTTALETGIGRMMTANLAAGLGSSEYAHGLATGSLLEKDFVKDSTFISKGSFYLHDVPGLGVVFNPARTELSLQSLEV